MVYASWLAGGGGPHRIQRWAVSVFVPCRSAAVGRPLEMGDVRDFA